MSVLYSRVMNNLRTLMIFLFILFFLTLLIRRKSNDLPPPPPNCPPLTTQTCLQSYDADRLHKSIFHMSMIHFTVPSTLSDWIRGKAGFEIGAPSHSTWGNLGVYDAAATMDTTNFAANTLWESGLKDSSPFLWKNEAKGKQYLRDAVDLHGIPNESYDFVCGCDVLEHIANPFKALLEWLRIMRSGGLLLIIVPFKNVTFDHRREVNRIEHLINDYHNQTSEADLSHLNEILRLHDIERDQAAGGIDSFKARSEKNLQHRGLHQHIYDQELLYYIYLCLNLEVKAQFIWDYHNLIIGQKR